MTSEKIITVGILMFCILIGMIIGGLIAKMRWRKEAIEHKAAQYNQTTGQFEWIEKGDMK